MVEFLNIALKVAFGIFAAIAVAFILGISFKKEENKKQNINDNA